VRRLTSDVEGEILVAAGHSCTACSSTTSSTSSDSWSSRFVLGSGRRIFPETPDKKVFELLDTRTYDSGVEVHAYRLPDRVAAEAAG
jgi:hypothetical protein